MAKKEKKEKEEITFTDVSESSQTGGQIREKKQSTAGKNLIPKESARYARARLRSM